MTVHFLGLLLIPAMAVLNRVRGAGTFNLPVRGIYLVSPAVLGLEWLASGSWLLGLILGLAYLAWGAPSWGKQIVVVGSSGADARPYAGLSAFIHRFDFGSKPWALLIRMGMFLMPACFVLWLCGFKWAEVASGAGWGTVLWLEAVAL